jgi:hypothetical protein
LGLISLGGALVQRPLNGSKLALKIGDDRFRIVQGAVTCQAHLRTSSGPISRADHTAIGSGYYVVVDRDGHRSCE